MTIPAIGRFDGYDVKQITLDGPIGDFVLTRRDADVHAAARDPGEVAVPNDV